MKLFLIFHGRFPSEKAASLFAAKSCEAFANRGIGVTLLAPRRLGRIGKDYSDFYGIKNNFEVVFLPTLDIFWLPFFKKISFAISFWAFSLFSFLYLVLRAEKSDIIYSNETLPLFLASFVFPNTVYEMHDFPKSKIWFYKLLFFRVNSIIATNNWKREKLIENNKFPDHKILFEPNAVDVNKFSGAPSKEEARKNLGLPVNRFLIGYAGMLKTMGMEKGMDIALEAMKLLGPESFLVVVGGSKEDVEYYKQKSADLGIGEKVRFAGWVRHESVPQYLAACDVLIAPFPQSDHYNFYMSPMKIFEYMASKRPIVASDLISIREILTDDKSGILVRPGDYANLASAIKKIYDSPGMAQGLVEGAYGFVLGHTWEKRAERILNFLKKRVKV